ncbi:MAG: lipid A phosphoethanolamine transferase [Deferribacteraceae bacterium]|jgi:glucan phosphoethanolaminetransferase (alkaline phosphatase superfamily)|nr:lipid A phosphoethanolamine transferase [Deferribacteraceae bacterium]
MFFISCKQKYIVFVAVFSLLFSLLYNIPYYITVLKGDIPVLIFAVILATAETLIFWYLLALNRWVLLITGAVTVFLAASFSYYMVTYKIMISVGLIRVIMLADQREVSAFFEPAAVLWVILSLLFFTLLMVWRFRIKKKPKPLAVIAMLVLLALIATAGRTVHPEAIKKHMAMPYVYYEHIYHYFLENRRINAFLRNKTDINSQYTFQFDNEGDPMTMVVVIGESLRGDRLGINGYPRPTTPNIEASGAYSFRNALSCTTLTSHSVACMMTRGTTDNWELSLKETSVISVFRKLGFSTYWISNQGRVGHDTWVGSIAIEADNISFCDDRRISGNQSGDQCLLPMVQNALDDPNPHKFIIVHTYGNHIRYDERYGPEFEKFVPVCDKNKPMSECHGDELGNIYDNSVLAVDDFYAKLTGLMKERNVFLFYLSDHGEPLGENGIRARGNNDNRFERTIPFIVWLSDSMKENQPEIENIIKENLDKAVSHDYLIYSALSCSGIKSIFVDDKLSVCNPDMVSYADPYLE